MSIDIVRLQQLATAFSPSAPIDQQALFSGRAPQLMDVLTAINQKGQHAVLFGERGVGKTSLARVLSAAVHVGGTPLIVGSINCDPTMTFSSLWHKVAREISIATSRPGMGFTSIPANGVTTLDQMLPAAVCPDDVRYLFSRVGKTLIIIDELDRLQDPTITALLADTIKTLSDHAVDATLLLVGVADSVDSLIKEHQSVERALVQVRMPRMSQTELFEIIDKGLKHAGMVIQPGAKARIAKLSQGLPHYTHLLTLYAAQRAVHAGRVEVSAEDVRTAIDSAVAKAQQSIISAYHTATSSPRDNLYQQVLLACALANQDNLGFFAAVDVRAPLSRIMKKPYDIPAFSQHLNAFRDSVRGPVLQREGSTRRYRFRFINPLMQPFVIMNGLRTGLIEETEI